jgi:hypothetical protein
MGSPKAPKPVKAPEPPPIEEDVDPEVRMARDRSRQRAAATFGRRQTLLTPGGAAGISGMGGASVGGRSILGG